MNSLPSKAPVVYKCLLNIGVNTSADSAEPIQFLSKLSIDKLTPAPTGTHVKGVQRGNKSLRVMFLFATVSEGDYSSQIK